MSDVRALRWADAGAGVEILDQTLLPEQEVWLRLGSAAEVASAIRDLRVRGAPAIGIAAAMGLAVEMARHAGLERDEFLRRLDAAYTELAGARPTAVNLRWALDRLRRLADSLGDAGNGVIACKLWGEATAILDEDRAMCRAIGEHAFALLPEPEARVLTHCNAGALATGGIGTALAPLYVGHERGLRLKVYADETRPLLQGSRLTAWELRRAGIDVTILPDSAAAVLMREGVLDLVIVGADRIAANGDVANKVGTYGVAVLARHHGLPFYVAAPTSTIDPHAASGAAIPIEQRDADEVRRGFGRLTAPAEAAVFAPAFDITPAELISAIITERGILRPPYDASIADALALDTAQHPPV
jgi:methylthioribose-1-phosphate isomerase